MSSGPNGLKVMRLECWNNGMMGSGKLREWFVGKITLTGHEKMRKRHIKHQTKDEIPSFQYSIISCER
jgi:hypothetical protein